MGESDKTMQNTKVIGTCKKKKSKSRVGSTTSVNVKNYKISVFQRVIKISTSNILLVKILNSWTIVFGLFLLLLFAFGRWIYCCGQYKCHAMCVCAIKTHHIKEMQYNRANQKLSLHHVCDVHEKKSNNNKNMASQRNNPEQL